MQIKVAAALDQNGKLQWKDPYANAIRNRLRRDQNLKDVASATESIHNLGIDKLFQDNTQSILETVRAYVTGELSRFRTDNIVPLQNTLTDHGSRITALEGTLQDALGQIADLRSAIEALNGALSGQMNNMNSSLDERIKAIEAALPGMNDHIANLVRMVNDNTFVKNRSGQEHSIALAFNNDSKGIYITGYIDGNSYPFNVTGLAPSMNLNINNMIDLGTGVPCTMPANGWLSLTGGGKGTADYYLDGQRVAFFNGEYGATSTVYIPVHQGQVLTANYGHYGNTYWIKLFPY